MNEKVIEQMRKKSIYLSKYTCQDDEALYLNKENILFRTPFFKDIDRIIYSLAFIRYQDKTQVFSKLKHDHVSKRMIHVQFVSKIARTIGRALGLNEDLIEAAALGHDLGHVPFGHTGEHILNELSLEYGCGYFNHNVESVRKLMVIENYGRGLNITVQVLDAILCHNGEMALGKYEPRNKTKEEFLEEYEATYKDKKVLGSLKPMTLEGCVVRVSDLIAYLGRDIDDAVRLGLIKRKDIPQNIKNVLGSTTSEIVGNCVRDIVNNSYGCNYVLLSEDVYKAIEELKKFNYENIYYKSLTKEEIGELKEMFAKLFRSYISDLENNNETSPIISSYLKNMTKEYRDNNRNERIVIDYIAGMTDDYFLREYERINTTD